MRLRLEYRVLIVILLAGASFWNWSSIRSVEMRTAEAEVWFRDHCEVIDLFADLFPQALCSVVCDDVCSWRANVLIQGGYVLSFAVEARAVEGSFEYLRCEGKLRALSWIRDTGHGTLAITYDTSSVWDFNEEQLRGLHASQGDWGAIGVNLRHGPLLNAEKLERRWGGTPIR